MPIPVIAILAVGVVSALWPAPKLDHQAPASGGVFAPASVSTFRPRETQTFKAEVTIPTVNQDEIKLDTWK